jgi:hypothetical protein
LEHDELAGLVEQAMALLPAATRNVLVERYLEERSHAEIAGRLGLSPGAVAMRLKRGKDALRRALETELREDAMSYGLLPDAGIPQSTRIWCPSCGHARLSCLVVPHGRIVEMQCSVCRTVISDRAASYLHEVKGHWRTMVRCLRGAHRYFRDAILQGRAECARCGHPAPLHMSLPGNPRTLRTEGVHVRCETCEAISFQPIDGLVLTLPAVEQFWQKHRRVRMLPPRSIETEGRAALLSRVESVTGQAKLDIVSARDTFEVLAVFEYPAMAQKERA